MDFYRGKVCGGHLHLVHVIRIKYPERVVRNGQCKEPQENAEWGYLEGYGQEHGAIGANQPRNIQYNARLSSETGDEIQLTCLAILLIIGDLVDDDHGPHEESRDQRNDKRFPGNRSCLHIECTETDDGSEINQQAQFAEPPVTVSYGRHGVKDGRKYSDDSEDQDRPAGNDSQVNSYNDPYEIT